MVLVYVALLDDSPPPAPKLTELDRLAFTIREIDRVCAVSPLGAYTMGATLMVAKDPMLKGALEYRDNVGPNFKESVQHGL